MKARGNPSALPGGLDVAPPVIEPPVAVRNEVESMEIEVVIDPRAGITAPSWMMSVVPLETAKGRMES
jgi:hypothetical protein